MTVSVPFRPHSSAHNAVSSMPMAVAECRALLHCPEVPAMRLWPLIEHVWLRALSICRCDQQGTAALAFECAVCDRSCWRASYM